MCGKLYGLVVEVDGMQVTSAKGDRDHPMTAGYSCTKGRNIGTLTAHPSRFLTAPRGSRRGEFVLLDPDLAIREVGVALRAIIDEHGPDSIGMFLGTQGYLATLTMPFAFAWIAATGSRKLFQTMSIDQSAKIVAAERLGSWEAGNQRFQDADVWMFVGTNPLISMLGGGNSPGTGFPSHGGRRGIREARARGLRLIVVDPRRSETAAEADRHLQLRPGTDALLLASMAHVIIEEELYDKSFCASTLTD